MNGSNALPERITVIVQCHSLGVVDKIIMIIVYYYTLQD